MTRYFYIIFFSAISTYSAFSQCPDSGTITMSCVQTGDLDIRNTTLTVSSGVTVTINGGDLILRGGATLNATGATFDIDGGIDEGNGFNTINGGTFDITGNFAIGGGGAFTGDGITVNMSGGTVSLAGTDITLDNSTITGAGDVTMNLTTFSADNTDVTASGNFTFQNATIANSTFNIGGVVTVNSGSSTIDNTTINAGTNNTAPATGIMAFDFNGGGDLTANNGSQINVTGDWMNNEILIDNSNVVITGDFDNAGAEIVTVQNGGSLSVGGDFDNSGSGDVSSDSGGLISVDGDFDNTNGDVDTNGGVVVVGGGFTGDTPTGDGSSCSTGGGECCGDTALCGTLPVSLVSFNGFVLDGLVTLTWRTASEENNDFFTLSRSFDGEEFEEIAVVDGNGTTSQPTNYSYRDSPVSFGGVFYRLQQTDFDGTSEVLRTIFIEIDALASQVILYPSRLSTNDDLKIKGLTENLQGKLEIEIIGTDGKSLDDLKSEAYGSELLIRLSNLRLSPGVYLIKGKASKFEFQKKFIVSDN